MTNTNKTNKEAEFGGSALNDGLGLPKEPSIGLLISMAIRYDPGLAIPNYYNTLPIQFGQTQKQRFDATISVMRQLYEEVSGHGFYSADKESEYLAMMPNA